MPRYPDPDESWVESAKETALRLGRIAYIDESVMYLPPRENLSIIDVHLPGINPTNPTLHEGDGSQPEKDLSGNTPDTE
jgi:hypothetical protein